MSKKILIFNRMDASLFPGGDTVQIKEIYNFLLNQGYIVDISDNPLIDLTNYDVVLIFNLTNPYEAYLFSKAVIRYDKPYILFPVYWNLDSLRYSTGWEAKYILRKILPKSVKSLYKGIKFIKYNNEYLNKLNINKLNLLNEKKIIREILKNAQYICPNSFAELDHLEENFRIKELNAHIKVIYNGVNIEKIRNNNISNKNETLKKYSLPSKYICCVGGIGPRKNQLNLVKAANNVNVPLIIIGKASKGCEEYYNKVKQIANKNHIIFLGHLPQNEVFSIMAYSSGHIQPSFIETPGLASLEAGALGISIGVSDTPPVREYFKNNAIYFNPESIDDIAKCLELLYKNEELNNRVNRFEEFSWDNVLTELPKLFF